MVANNAPTTLTVRIKSLTVGGNAIDWQEVNLTLAATVADSGGAVLANREVTEQVKESFNDNESHNFTWIGDKMSTALSLAIDDIFADPSIENALVSSAPKPTPNGIIIPAPQNP